MFLEKLHRFVRQYRFAFYPRKQRAPVLPLVGKEGEYSILDALKEGVKNHSALTVQPNGDIVELMWIDYVPKLKSVVGLIHRASPNAADPMYRKKARKGYSLRQVDRDPDEEQAVSAHLIIDAAAIDDGVYEAILEEIPGLSMGLVQGVIGRTLLDYQYPFTDKKGEEDETYTVFRPRGVKSETVSNALKTGRANFITLSRKAQASFIDSEDVFEPKEEKMRIKIKKDIDPKSWMPVIGGLARRARANGWDDFQVDIELDDERMKRIPIARGEEAKEVLFIRSAEVHVKNEMPVCSGTMNEEFAKAAIKAVQ